MVIVATTKLERTKEFDALVSVKEVSESDMQWPNGSYLGSLKVILPYFCKIAAKNSIFLIINIDKRSTKRNNFAPL
jgi:hypothetical protein